MPAFMYGCCNSRVLRGEWYAHHSEYQQRQKVLQCDTPTRHSRRENRAQMMVCTLEQEFPQSSLEYVPSTVPHRSSKMSRPGDLRVLRTADIPELHYLRNVIVFSSLGDRPEPSKMSGGDLDGDLYAIIMDPDLLPPPTSAGGYRNSEPMGYEAPVGVPVKASGSHVTVKVRVQCNR